MYGYLLWNMELFQFRIEDKTFIHFPYIEEENVGLDAWRILSLEVAQDGKIWVGTSALGIQIIDPKLPPNQRMQYFNQSNGLINDKISKIIRDQAGDLWISTLGGINKYASKTKQFIAYTAKDGLWSNVLHYGIHLLENKSIAIAQRNGFQLLNIDDLYSNIHPPPVVLTGFKVFEQDKVLEKNINYLDQLVLNSKENFFSIHFAALNFSQAEKNAFAYQMEGVDRDWIYPKDKRTFANYTNVNSGEFLFKVKAANNSGVWSEEAAHLKNTNPSSVVVE